MMILGSESSDSIVLRAGFELHIFMGVQDTACSTVNLKSGIREHTLPFAVSPQVLYDLDIFPEMPSSSTRNNPHKIK